MEEEPKSYKAIMVSSTFTDLEAHRREIIDAIHRFGFHASVMEYGGARSDADVIEASLRMVRDAVAYVCVIGHKYGQTPVDADRNPGGLSITELEFNEARRLGRPILLFLMADDHPVTKGDVEPDAKKSKKLEAFRKQAKRVDPGAAAERVHESFASKDEFAKKAAIAVGLQAIQAAGGSGIPDRAVRDAIARFIDVKPEANQAELADAIERFEAGYRALEQQLATITVSDNRVTSLKADAEAALAEGDLDKARAAYREAADAARDKAAEPVRTAAELKSAEAGAHLLALDWEAADTAWAEAAAMLTLFDKEAAEKIMNGAAERLHSHAEAFARAGALGAAATHLRQLVRAVQARDDQQELARVHNNIGNVLALQGESIGGAEGQRLLSEGIDALREALKVVSARDAPAWWSMMQSNLGDALRAKGERAGGSLGIQVLNEAVDAFHSALSVCRLQDSPPDWAMLQNNLGIALAVKGRIAKGMEEKKTLDEAIIAFRSSLSIDPAALPPQEWARMQVNLGNALLARGMVEPDAAVSHLLKEAIANYRDALRFYTDADLPSGQAWVQLCLGSALLLQGRHTDGEAKRLLVADGVQAYQNALMIYTATDRPIDWSTTQFNLGLAYESMADADPDQVHMHLASAEEAFLAALEVYTRSDMTQDKEVEASLARVRARLAALDA